MTPNDAIKALENFFPYQFSIVWMPHSDDGQLAETIRNSLYLQVIETEENFFKCSLPQYYDVQITEPPPDRKDEWLKRSLEHRKPFALLLPSEIIFVPKAIHLIENNDLEIIIPHKSTKKLDLCWFTCGFNMGRRLTYVDIS